VTSFAVPLRDEEVCAQGHARADAMEREERRRCVPMSRGCARLEPRQVHTDRAVVLSRSPTDGLAPDQLGAKPASLMAFCTSGLAMKMFQTSWVR
jgi:hypothetical protein